MHLDCIVEFPTAGIAVLLVVLLHSSFDTSIWSIAIFPLIPPGERLDC
jgi:hypothetical protein